MIPSVCAAQYQGGVNDGVASGMAAVQNALPAIYVGGPNDGYDLKQSGNQNPSASIYHGGSNDGVAMLTAPAQNTMPQIYTGGSDDGVASALASAQNMMPVIYMGGSDDGAAIAKANIQNASPAIYRGGQNDGVSSLFATDENTSPNIYSGGADDGYAFSIAAGQNSSFPLQLSVLQFDASWFDEDAILAWQTQNEQALDHFELERSEGGDAFHFVARIAPGNAAGDDYRYADARAYELPAEFLLYRLKMVDGRGNVRYSGVVKLSKDKAAPVIAAYPNPTRGRFTLAIVDGYNLAGYSYVISTSEGRIVRRNTVNATHTVIDLDGLPAAAYHVLVFKGAQALQHFTILLTP